MGTINFSEIRGIRGVPPVAGYRIVENFVIAAYYATKNSHSTDVYDFVLVKHDGTNERLFHGMLQGEETEEGAIKNNPKAINETVGASLTAALNDFAQSGIRKIASKTPKCITKRYKNERHIFLVACQCEEGTIIGGWYNSEADSDVALQMIAYCMYTFAAINITAGKYDKKLHWYAYDKIPNDFRFGKFDATEAATIRNREYLGREERMRKRAIRELNS